MRVTEVRLERMVSRANGAVTVAAVSIRIEEDDDPEEALSRARRLLNQLENIDDVDATDTDNAIPKEDDGPF